MKYRVVPAGFKFKKGKNKGKGYYNIRQVPAYCVEREDGKSSQATTILEEAQVWCEMLNDGFRPTGVYI